MSKDTASAGLESGRHTPDLVASCEFSFRSFDFYLKAMGTVIYYIVYEKSFLIFRMILKKNSGSNPNNSTGSGI